MTVTEIVNSKLPPSIKVAKLVKKHGMTADEADRLVGLVPGIPGEELNDSDTREDED